MKKKVKLHFDALRVNSFITSIHESESAEMKGGTELSCTQQCNTLHQGCQLSRHNVCPSAPPACIPNTILTGCNTLIAGCG